MSVEHLGFGETGWGPRLTLSSGCLEMMDEESKGPSYTSRGFVPGHCFGSLRDEGVYKLGRGQGNVGSPLHPLWCGC